MEFAFNWATCLGVKYHLNFLLCRFFFILGTSVWLLRHIAAAKPNPHRLSWIFTEQRVYKFVKQCHLFNYPIIIIKHLIYQRIHTQIGASRTHQAVNHVVYKLAFVGHLVLRLHEIRLTLNDFLCAFFSQSSLSRRASAGARLHA